MINVLSFLVILLLIFINGITDASNAVSTVVGTKVLSYRRACFLSAMFNVIGIVVMYFLNASVTSTISEIVILPQNNTGLTMITVAMISTIFFSILSLLKGIPASESYGLIFGLIGAAIYIGGIKNINMKKIKLVLIGICFSIIISVVIAKILLYFLKNIVSRIEKNKIKKMQILSCMGLSIAHGAQDGLKFIGILRLYKNIITQTIDNNNEIILVALCAITMALGTMIGGKKIIISVGEKLTKLDNQTALISEIGTTITLLLGNIFGLPLSTSHVKTMTTLGVGKKELLNKNKIKEMIITWLFVLPACMGMSFILMKIATERDAPFSVGGHL